MMNLINSIIILTETTYQQHNCGSIMINFIMKQCYGESGSLIRCV